MKRGPVWVAVLVLLLVVVPHAIGNDNGPLDQDDAGSGGDAPSTFTKDITIYPDIVYEGSSPGPVLDNSDVYHLEGAAGQLFRGWADGNTGCYALHDANGGVLDNACSYAGTPRNSGPVVLELPYTGDYYFRVAHLAPATYKFGFSLEKAAPEVRTLPFGQVDDYVAAEPLPVPEGCHNGFEYTAGTLGTVERFTDECYHMRTGLNNLKTADIDILIVPPVSTYPERDLRVMRQAVEMWVDGIHMLAPQMGLDWLGDGVRFQIFVDEEMHTDPLWDPEIVVVATNPVGGAGIGVDPFDFIFGGEGPCHGQPNPLAGFDTWSLLPGFDNHHGGKSGTYFEECEGGGTICFAVNGAIDPVPGVVDFFGLYDLVAHEVGHCLTIGHVGDAGDHKANAVPYADIMSYTNQPHDKCVSTLDVESFAVTMSRILLDTPFAANDAFGTARGSFQIQHPDDHWYASPTGLARDCPQPDADLVPGGYPIDPLAQDDAGSGRDAPDTLSKDITIEPDIVYHGTVYGPGLDAIDTYHLFGEAGQIFKGWADGYLGCHYLYDKDGVRFEDYSCGFAYTLDSGPIVVELPYTGDYYFQINSLEPALYQFGFSLENEAPRAGILDRL